MLAALAYSSPRAVGLLEMTRRISIGNSPASRLAMRLRSVVPPPEIKTAIGSGCVIVHISPQRLGDTEEGRWKMSDGRRQMEEADELIAILNPQSAIPPSSSSPRLCVSASPWFILIVEQKGLL